MNTLAARTGSGAEHLPHDGVEARTADLVMGVMPCSFAADTAMPEANFAMCGHWLERMMVRPWPKWASFRSQPPWMTGLPVADHGPSRTHIALQRAQSSEGSMTNMGWRRWPRSVLP